MNENTEVTKFTLTDHISDEMLGQICDDDGKVDLDKLTRAYQVATQADLNKQKAADELELKRQELEERKRENDLREREAEFNEKKLEADTTLRQAELNTQINANVAQEKANQQQKIFNIAGTVVKVLGLALFGWLTIYTQKKDQEFQTEGFGYENETSKRSSDMKNDFLKLL